mmetsp:Transcript_48932/g.119830  ORF Transcript_48932/g.119830 Transcript_48932/m.119830 type:complete len:216 (+) Transcript_48932:790-1437(+)
MMPRSVPMADVMVAPLCVCVCVCAYGSRSVTMGNKGSSLTKEQMKALQKEFNVSKDEIKKLHKVWLTYRLPEADGKAAGMDREGFVKFCDDVGNEDGNVPTIFDFIDTSGDGRIQFEEWIVFVLRAKNPSFDDYAQLVIDLYDEDNSGTVSREEVRKLAMAKAKIEGRLTPEREAEIETTIENIFKFADADGDGELTKEELIAAAKKDPNFAQAL